MMRYGDQKNAGRSELVPFRKGETAGERHARRLKAALDARPQAQKRCVELGVSLKISNDGQHWQFTGAVVADWWPSSAKLVLRKQYSHGIHCHDWTQALAQIERIAKAAH